MEVQENSKRLEDSESSFNNTNGKVDFRANDQALEFLSNIDTSTWNSLLFPDALVIISQTGKEIGEMKISVEEATWHDEDCYLVHASSNGTVDQVQMGTSITAYVNRSLKTLEQTQHEYMKIKENPLDKRTQIIAEEGGYVVKKTVSQGEEVRKTSTSLPTEGFISEGSNLLLERVLAKKNVVPDNMVFVALDTLDTKTKLCTSTYRSLGERTQAVATEIIGVVGVERTIHSTEETPTVWQSSYLPNGHLVSRTQLGSQVTMTVLQIPVDQEQKKENKKAGDSQKVKPLKWEEDMQLYSNFLDRKAELGDDHATYMRRHPELRALLADFLQFLLLKKPDDVCDFASDFFGAFSTAAPSLPSFAKSNSTPRPTSSSMP